MKKVRILWSGITGRTGTQALNISETNEYATVVAGVCRNDERFYNYDQLYDIKEEFDVIVDFSHKDSFDKILEFAIKMKKPLIIGTARLSEEQLKAIDEAALIIPVFRGGNFIFEVKKFIDDVVSYAKAYDGEIKLVETHYKTKKIPSETAKGIYRRILNETGKEIEIESLLEYDELINDYRVDHLHCRIFGFRKLVEDVFKVASMLIIKKPDGVYDLDKLMSDSEQISYIKS